LSVSLLTVGDPRRTTGGYLYHRKIADRAADHRVRVEFVSLPDRAIRPGRDLRALRSQHTDVLLIDSLATARLAPFIALLPALPRASILHQPPGGFVGSRLRRRLRAGADLFVYRRVDRLIAASQMLADQLAGHGFASDSIAVVPPGRDLPGTQPAASEPTRDGEVTALSVANWLPQKGILEMLEAFSRLSFAEVTLDLAGNDRSDLRYRRAVLSRLAQPDLQGKVRVHGWLDSSRLAALYGQAGMFVTASRDETYATAVGEAMGFGVAVVGWASGNVANLVSHDRDGLLVPAGDIDGLTGAMERVCIDRNLRDRLGREATQTAARLPTWDETATRLFQNLREVAAAGRRRSIAYRRE
jgi:glycosyltransferase involved in cell wall biosynthesis